LSSVATNRIEIKTTPASADQNVHVPGTDGRGPLAELGRLLPRGIPTRKRHTLYNINKTPAANTITNKTKIIWL